MLLIRQSVGLGESVEGEGGPLEAMARYRHRLRHFCLDHRTVSVSLDRFEICGTTGSPRTGGRAVARYIFGMSIIARHKPKYSLLLLMPSNSPNLISPLFLPFHPRSKFEVILDSLKDFFLQSRGSDRSRSSDSHDSVHDIKYSDVDSDSGFLHHPVFRPGSINSYYSLNIEFYYLFFASIHPDR